MRVCATDQLPPLVVQGTQQAECWLLDPPSGELGRPLERAEVSVADEA